MLCEMITTIRLVNSHPFIQFPSFSVCVVIMLKVGSQQISNTQTYSRHTKDRQEATCATMEKSAHKEEKRETKDV